MADRWFRIKGQPNGERTVAEQLIGLAPALAEARGKSVLDLGAAEGCISIEFSKAGAVPVHGVECNAAAVDVANSLCKEMANVTVFQGNLNDGLPAGCLPQYDIVLALAILHKMGAPENAARLFCEAARSLLVVRLPGGSDGYFRTKAHREPCDTNLVMPECGFALEKTLPGPRDELVQHWRRLGNR